MMDAAGIQALAALIQAIAIVIGGVWAYFRFVRRRENEPAIDIDVDVRFVGVQADRWIIEVTVFVENKSLVRLRYEKLGLRTRYLLPDDPIEEAPEKINYQLNCPRTLEEDLPGRKRYFANVKYINPRQAFKHRYVTSIPAKATFVWVQCDFPFGTKDDKMNSQKIFRVPAREAAANEGISQTQMGDGAQPGIGARP